MLIGIDKNRLMDQQSLQQYSLKIIIQYFEYYIYDN